MSNGNMVTAAEKRAGVLGTLQQSSDLGRASSQHTQKSYQRDLDRRLRNDREKIRTGDYAFNDVSNGVTETPMLQMRSKDLIECWDRTKTQWSLSERSSLKRLQRTVLLLRIGQLAWRQYR